MGICRQCCLHAAACTRTQHVTPEFPLHCHVLLLQYSGTRDGVGKEHDARFRRYVSVLYGHLTREAGLGPSRLAWAVNDDAGHNEAAWAARLPAALQFLGGGWWTRWQERCGNELVFTLPRRLKAGLSGQLLYFNRALSPTLSMLPREAGIAVTVGMDGWNSTTLLPMTPVDVLAPLRVLPPAHLQVEVWESWRQEQLAVLLAEHEQKLQEHRRRLEQHKLRVAEHQRLVKELAAQAAALAAALGREPGSIGSRNGAQQLPAVPPPPPPPPPPQPTMNPELQRLLEEPLPPCSLAGLGG